MEYRPVILMIPKDSEQITVSCLVGNELVVEDYDMKNIEKTLLKQEVKNEQKTD